MQGNIWNISTIDSKTTTLVLLVRYKITNQRKRQHVPLKRSQMFLILSETRVYTALRHVLGTAAVMVPPLRHPLSPFFRGERGHRRSARLISPFIQRAPGSPAASLLLLSKYTLRCIRIQSLFRLRSSTLSPTPYSL